MIIVMKHEASKEEINLVETRLDELGYKTHPIYGEGQTVIGAVGVHRPANAETLAIMAGVEKVVPIMKPFKLASRELYKENTVIQVGNATIGGTRLTVMAGPCAIESEEQLIATAQAVKASGATILRGGAFKPRTSPYAFQGLEEEGLKFMVAAREATGLPIVTEVLDTRDVELVDSYTDIIQIGARNMQNFRLLKEVGQSNRPILLKRGLSATMEEWMMAAEYIMSEGNDKVILCERGIITFENATRFTTDINAIPVIKHHSHLPVVLDPSHAAGDWRYVADIALAGIAAGADGLEIEVHNHPSQAKSDSAQALTPEKFIEFMARARRVAAAVDRSISPAEAMMQ
jgi:3-deoxy-7-phosphoheptulonate synthase